MSVTSKTYKYSGKCTLQRDQGVSTKRKYVETVEVKRQDLLQGDQSNCLPLEIYDVDKLVGRNFSDSEL